MKHTQSLAAVAMGALLLLCARGNYDVLPYGAFESAIPIPEPSPQQRARFNASAGADFAIRQGPDGSTLKGYVSANREFLAEVVEPLLEPYRPWLAGLTQVELINALALFGHELYHRYFGPDFYRWGGDLLDLDDPQEEGIHHQLRYGLDCSGFATFPYDLAVHLGLLQAEEPGALFSAAGFARFCAQSGMHDTGGRLGGGNRFRLDTAELATLGREVFALPKGGSPTASQLALLQPGDLVGRSGHFGLIVEIRGEPYFLESGGWVGPIVGNYPCHARRALAMFARTGPIAIRRALPDRRSLARNDQKASQPSASR